MKPIELELSWFGQYTASQCIPFHRLDKVFLITGETGAGKTTLFDAICYALYGRGLGARSSGRALRSELASDTDSTIVRFRFEARGVTWEVERSPHKYVRTKRTGTVETDEYVLLRRLTGEGSPADIPPAEVDERLQAVIGLQYPDFSKILVLPQGEFQQFLTMRSAERAKLLKTIFPVGSHEAISLRAKEEAKGVRKELEDNEAAVREVKRNFDEEGFPARELELEAQVEALRAAEEMGRQAADQAKAALHEGRTLASQIAELAARVGERDKHLAGRADHEARQTKLGAGRRAANAIPAVDKLEELRRELSRLDGTLGEARKEEDDAGTAQDLLRPAYDAIPAREEALTAAKLAVQDLERLLQDLGALAVALATESELGKQVADHTTRVADARSVVKLADDALKALDLVSEEREALQPSLAEAHEALNACERARADAEAVSTWNEETSTRLEEKLNVELEELTRSEAELDAAKTALGAARARVEADAALVVAHALRPGEPCPACGSTAHPLPRTGAPGEGDAIALLRAAEEVFESASRGLGARATRVTQAKTAAELGKQAAAEAAERLAGHGYSDPEAWQLALTTALARLKSLRVQDSALTAKLGERPRLSRDADDARGVLERLERELQEATAKLAEASGAILGLRKRVGEVSDVVAEVAAVTAARERAEQENRTEETAIGALRKDWLEAESKAAAARSKAASLQAERDKWSEQAPAVSAAAAASLEEQGFATAEAARLAAVPPRELEDLQRQVSDWDTTLAEFGSVISGLEAAIGDRPNPNLEALEESDRNTATAATEAAETRRTREEELKDLRGTAKRLKELRDAKAKLLADKRGLLVLARRLNGEGAARIDFATWMLTWWLEQVLAHASTRMIALSEGRYTFRLRTEVKDGRSAAGLDVDVHDTWSNNLRDVNALSGGEKFLASLSLALGLADVLQSHSGGVHLDTLFIDEGFGSLDTETLERAMDLIDEISQHRRVGLISHVESMQKAIFSQVVVTKSPKGSVATVI